MNKYVSNPKVSVIVPTYNRAEDLRRCLNALTTQTVDDFEVLVCDDGSTDQTADVVNEFLSWLDITYDYAENFGGPARPRNRGIRLARSPYIAFLDSDDWWSPEKLELSLRALDAGAVLVFHDLWNVQHANQKDFNKRVVSHQPHTPVYESLLCSCTSIPNSSVVVRTDILRSIGEICEDKEFIAVEDFDMLLRISRVTEKFVRLEECLGYYWNGGGNISAASARHILRTKAVYKRHLASLPEPLKARAQAVLAYRVGRLAQLHGDWEVAMENLKSAMYGNPGCNFRLKAMLLIPVIWLKRFISKCKI